MALSRTSSPSEHPAPPAVLLPDFEGVVSAFDHDDAHRRMVEHNHVVWACIHGGLGLVRRSPLDFDPRVEYWRRTERRVLVAYFATRFYDAYAPPGALRDLALRTFLHFDRARQDGRLGDPVLAGSARGLWADLAATILHVARELPTMEQYEDLRRVWGIRLKAKTLRDDLVAFVEGAAQNEWLEEVEPSFARRVSWFPYLGVESLDALVARQRFFLGYYCLCATTNSYVQGGGMSMAPVIQNNQTRLILGYVDRWARGETPQQTGFEVAGREETKDRSHHMPVVELFGFLNLPRGPFFNGLATETYGQFRQSGDSGIFESLFRIGELTRTFVRSRPALVERLAAGFRVIDEQSVQTRLLLMEGVGRESVRRKFPEDEARRVDHRLLAELVSDARAAALGLDDLDAACAMFHIMLDASMYEFARTRGESDAQITTTSPAQPTDVADPGEVISLPPSLRHVGNDALGYLRAGYHVLLAGPPGTGKTTLAQLIGHAWNEGLKGVAEELPMTQAPISTVGNSAWAPFHTIGGVMPGSGKTLERHRGIFVDPEWEVSGEWRLRPCCIVLDEMNRADLDRCIGELYPLLTRSVDRVYPAGIPGLRCLRTHPRFRIVATVNDATLDDIVFPISEGLARRFIRIELPGATAQDLKGFLWAEAPGQDERRAAAERIIEDLFEVCTQDDRVTRSDLGDHLPFGVGYFGTLRAWVRGTLALSREFGEMDLREQARRLITTSLSSAVRVRGLERILDRLRGPEETS